MRRVRSLVLLLVVVAMGFGGRNVAGEEPPPTEDSLPAFESMAPRSVQWETNPPLGAAAAFAPPVPLRAGERADSSPFGPQPLENWSRAVVQAISESGWDIYTFRLDGTDVRRLTDHPASDVNPSLNGAGTEIVFTSYRDGNSEIYKVATDGSSPPQRLTNSNGPDNWASWSPDGGQILFSSARDGQYELYVMNADGSNQHPIRSDPYSHDVMAVWDIYGSIYFVRYGVSGRGAVVWIAGQGLDEFLTAEMQGIENLRVQRNNSTSQRMILFDANIDSDGATELLGCLTPTQCDVQLLYDANSSTVDVLAGSWAPITDSTRPEGAVLFSLMQFRTEGDQYIIEDLVVQLGRFVNQQGLDQIKSIVGLAIPTVWRPDDNQGPIVGIGDMPEYVLVNENNTIAIPFVGTDPGGSGVMDITLEEDQGNSWYPVTSVPVTPENTSVTIYPNGFIRKYRASGRDFRNNYGPWSEPREVKLYDGFTAFQSMDVRGRTIPNAQFGDSPYFWPDTSQTDLNGFLRGRVWHNSGPSGSFSAPGYQGSEAYGGQTGRDPTATAATAVLLSGLDNIFQDGNMQREGFPEWRKSASDAVWDAGGRMGLGRELSYSPGGSNVEVSTTLHLSDTIHMPTLAFDLSDVSHFAYWEDTPDTFVFALDDGVTTTKLLTVTQESRDVAQLPLVWQALPVYAFDMTPWLGKTITLTLSLHSPSGPLTGRISIDRISLGSWTTPVIDSATISTTQGISPTLRLGAAEPLTRTLVLTGQNFLEGVQVEVGNVVLEGVQRVGEERLEVLLPGDLPIGLHHIWVRNADQTVAVLPNALGVGRQLYLSALFR